MITKKTCVLANFNCTFKFGDNVKPMLDYFDTIIYPALTDKSLSRDPKKKSKDSKFNQFFITDVSIVQMSDGKYALVGKHVKRTILTIKNDFEVEKGFIPVGSKQPSAPFSTFIILLHNHRLIHFPDQQGSPDIRSLASTIRSIVYDYIQKQYSQQLEELKLNDFMHDGVKYDNTNDFLQNYLLKKYTYPEINIVPIESENLVAEKFANINKIKNVKFKFYHPNGEKIEFDSFFGQAINFVEITGSKHLNQEFVSPENKDEIKKALISSNGKADYVMNAYDDNKNPIKLTPQTVSEKIKVPVDEELNLETNSQLVYNELKEESVLKQVSEENLNTYNNHIETIAQLEAVVELMNK